MDALFSPMGLSLGSLALLFISVLWLKLPVAVMLAGLGFGGLALLSGMEAASTMLGNELWVNFSGYGMTVVPLFILMGQLCYYSGLNERLYRTLHILAGHVPGGLAVATILACGGFAAICGSNTATAATMAGVALPEMKKYGYDPAFSAGTVAVGATLGVIIPPSVVLIVIGLQTGLSVSGLFMAAVLPGILLVLAFVVCTLATVLRSPRLAPRCPKAPLKDRLRAAPQLAEVGILWGGVLGSMGTGIVTPTEAGALGTALALTMGIVSRRLTFKGLFMALADTLRLTAMILLLVAGAMIYGKFLTATRLPFELSAIIAHMNAPVFAVLFCMLAIYFFGGMVMDALALLLITVPIFFPLAQSMGLDPIVFSLIITVVTTMGAVTPPIGVCVYVVSSIDRTTPLPSIFKGVFCYLPAYVAVVVLLILCPSLIVL